MLTLRAFKGATLMSAVILQQALKLDTLNMSFSHVFRLCWGAVYLPRTEITLSSTRQCGFFLSCHILGFNS